MSDLLLLLIVFALILFLTEGALREQVSSAPAYEIVIPKKQDTVTAGATQEHTGDNVSYSIQIAGHTHILKLKRNKKLSSKSFTTYIYSKDGILDISKSKLQVDCYYQGFVEGVENSVVALSLCHGLRGIIHFAEWQYGIEPLVASSRQEHLLFQLPYLPGESFACGVPSPDLLHQENLSPEPVHDMNGFLSNPSEKAFHRYKRAVLPTTSFVELCIVVDNNRYREKSFNQSLVTEDVLALVNAVDVMFQPLNIKIVLIGLIIWSDSNPIEVKDGTAGDVLGRFSAWRGKEKGLKRSDITHLLIGRDSFGGTVGMAYVGTVCSPTLGSSISTVNAGDAVSRATVVAHELGHNLGMNHDDKRCSSSNYIMNSMDSNAKNFSSCSADDFEHLVINGQGRCLRNPPNPSDVISKAVCGNKVVESSEECDCGSKQDCRNPCCNAETCRLTSGSQCAQGMCCENCKFKGAGSECRAKSNECDLAEYCNGSNALCPIDVYIMNGHRCDSNRAYCFNGICQTYDSQCQALFGEGTTKAIDQCFQEANIRGDTVGNCGLLGASYKKCAIVDSLCGKLQCQNVKNIPDGIMTTFSSNGVKCTSVDFNLGTDVPDPGLVHQGSPCGDGKACVDYHCVNATYLGYSCDVTQKCHNRGICNNNGNCHCDRDWAPPSCDRSGCGGSLDSGPTCIDTSLRDGLLIFFLLVLPILIVLIVCFIKRNALRKRFCRRKRQYRSEHVQPGARRNQAVGNSASAHQVEPSVFTISHFPASRNHMPPGTSAMPQRPPRPLDTPLRPPIPPHPAILPRRAV